MRAPPPLRFLVTVLGGWACLRIVMLWPGWTGEAAGPIREAQAAQTAQVAPAALRPAT